MRKKEKGRKMTEKEQRILSLNYKIKILKQLIRKKQLILDKLLDKLNNLEKEN